jgi:hypothetical protein
MAAAPNRSTPAARAAGTEYASTACKHDGVAGSDQQEPAHVPGASKPPERRGERAARDRRIAVHRCGQCCSREGDGAGRDEQREPDATEGYKRWGDDRGQHASERHRHLSHSQRPATSFGCIGENERPHAHDRNDRRPHAGQKQRCEESRAGRGERREGEAHNRDRGSSVHREARAVPIGRNSGWQVGEPDPEEACAEDEP